MAIHTPRGMASMGDSTWDTVPTGRSCFPRGIAPISRSLRYVGAPQNKGMHAKETQQILWNHAQEIASTYPDPQRAEYQAAAQTLRMPYWDWSIDSTMPDVVNQPVININAPDGAQSIVNPLYNYTFHPQPSATDFPPDEKVRSYPRTNSFDSSAPLLCATRP